MQDKEYTVAIVKWNVVKKIPEASDKPWIELHSGLQNFKVKYGIAKHVKDREWWAEFYAEHKGKDHFEPLIDYMTTDVCQFFILTHSDGDVIQRWRNAIGPTNAAITKKPSDCLRAIYGDDDALRSNGFHGSDSVEAAEREAKLIKQL